jgi:hypothetical protein
MDDKSQRREQGRRLALARVAAGFKSARAAALACGWAESTYRAHEAGERRIGQDDAEKYSKKFRAYGAKFTAQAILFGDESKLINKLIPVVGRIGAGAEILTESTPVPDQGIFQVEPNVLLSDGMIGFVIVGDYLWPRYDDGDVIVVDREGVSPDTLPDGVEAIVKTTDGRQLLRTVRREKGGWTLESHRTPAIYGVELAWASEVVTVVRARHWKILTKAAKRQ